MPPPPRKPPHNQLAKPSSHLAAIARVGFGAPALGWIGERAARCGAAARKSDGLVAHRRAGAPRTPTLAGSGTGVSGAGGPTGGSRADCVLTRRARVLRPSIQGRSAGVDPTA